MEWKVETTYDQFFEFDSLLHLSMLKVAKNMNNLSSLRQKSALTWSGF